AEAAGPPAAAAEGVSGGAGAAVPYSLPGEDAPSLFVPLHPQTVAERRLIDAVTDYSAARAFEHENLWSDAIDLLEKALALEPDSAAILKRLSSLCFALGKIDQGLKYGKRVLANEPDDPDTIGLLAAYYLKNDPAGAEMLLKEIVSNPRLDKSPPRRPARGVGARPLLLRPAEAGRPGRRCIRPRGGRAG